MKHDRSNDNAAISTCSLSSYVDKKCPQNTLNPYLFIMTVADVMPSATMNPQTNLAMLLLLSAQKYVPWMVGGAENL